MYDLIPLKCRHCGKDAWVDLANLDKRPYSEIITLQGFECSSCGRWETVSLETAAINNLLVRISRSKVGSTKYQKMMFKAINKIENLLVKIEEEMRHGKSKHSN